MYFLNVYSYDIEDFISFKKFVPEHNDKKNL